MSIESVQNTSKERSRTLSTAGAKLPKLNFLFFTKLYHFIKPSKVSPDSLQIGNSRQELSLAGWTEKWSLLNIFGKKKDSVFLNLIHEV